MIAPRSAILGLLLVCLSSLANAGDADAARDLRMDGWAVATPSEAGLDPEALDVLVEMINRGTTVPNVHALIVEHRGRLIFEHYWPGADRSFSGPLGVVEHGPTTLHDIRSVSKSVTSLLLGIALGDAASKAVHRPIASFFPDRDATGSGLEGVTLHQVLTMTAGLEWNETYVPFNSRNHFVQIAESSDPVSFMFARSRVHPPGSTWTYNSGLTDLVAGVIEQLTGQPFEEFAIEVLFEPLGISDYKWLRPNAWPDNHFPSASAGLRMRARDTAKIGSLVLHGGKWQGRQIVPAEWIAMSTARHVQHNPWGSPGVFGYGYFWFPGTLLSGDKAIRAVGWGDQRIFILPDAGMSVTIFAGNYVDCCHEVGERILGRIVRAIR